VSLSTFSQYEAVQVLERVRTRVADSLMMAQLPNFTVSFGVASSDLADQFQQVVALADEALLIVIATGGDRLSVGASAGTARPASDFSLTIGDQHVAVL
jgi:PleD family two-component response regulator